MMKPVWRLNTGIGVPDDLGELLIMASDDVDMVMSSTPFNEDSNFKHIENWKCRAEWWEIYAYQTTRTKPAKYRGKK